MTFGKYISIELLVEVSYCEIGSIGDAAFSVVSLANVDARVEFTHTDYL